MTIPDKPQGITEETYSQFIKVIKALQRDYIVIFRRKPSKETMQAAIAKARQAIKPKSREYYRMRGKKGAKARWGDCYD